MLRSFLVSSPLGLYRGDSLGALNLFQEGKQELGTVVSAMKSWYGCLNRAVKKGSVMGGFEDGVEAKHFISMQMDTGARAIVSLDKEAEREVKGDLIEEGYGFLGFEFHDGANLTTLAVARLYERLLAAGLVEEMNALIRGSFEGVWGVVRDDLEGDVFASMCVVPGRGNRIMVRCVGSEFREFYILCAKLLLRRDAGVLILNLSSFYHMGGAFNTLLSLLTKVSEKGGSQILLFSPPNPALEDFVRSAGGSLHTEWGSLF